MRTTITLEPDTADLVARAMRQRGQSFKEVVNEALRRALAPTGAGRVARVATYRMGAPQVPLDHALRLLGELDDADTARELEAGR